MLIGRSRVYEGGRVRYNYQWTHKFVLRLVFTVGNFNDRRGDHCNRPDVVGVDAGACESNEVVQTGVRSGSKTEVDDRVYERVGLLHD